MYRLSAAGRCFRPGSFRKAEGFTGRTAAAGLKVQENDYLSILAAPGSECPGALQMTDGALPPEEGSYLQLPAFWVK